MAEQRTIDPAPPGPPLDAPGGGGGGDGWALLATVGDRYEAEMIRGVLETDGIGPIVIQAVPVPGSWLLPAGHERIPQRVFVPRAVLEAARLALLEAGMVPEEELEPLAAEGPAATPRRIRNRVLEAVRGLVIVSLAAGFVTLIVRLVRSGSAWPLP